MPLLIDGEPFIHGLDEDPIRGLPSLTTDGLAHAQNTDIGTTAEFFRLGINLVAANTGPVRRGLYFDSGGAGNNTAFAWEARDADGGRTGRFVQCLNVLNGDPKNAGNVWEEFGFMRIAENEAGTHPAFSSARAAILFLLARNTAATPPVIGGFNPTSGPVGTVVLLNGNAFGATTGSVKLNSVAATVSGWSNSQITLAIPAGGATGKFEVTTAGGSDLSRDSFTVTSAVVYAVPGPVSGLAAVAGNGFVALNFNAPTDTGNRPISDYEIRFRLAGGVWSVYAHSPNTSTSQRVGGLTNNEAYEFTVAAKNSVGTGPASPVVTATPAGSVVVAPVFNASYTTNAADYAARCGAGATGPTATGTGSGATQDAADTAAFNDAVSRIVCPVAPVVFNSILNINNQVIDGLSFVPQGSESLEIDSLSASPSGPTIAVAIVSGGFTSYCDYNSEFGGKPARFKNRAGTPTMLTLPTSDTTLNF